MYPINKTQQKLSRGEFVFGVGLSELRSPGVPRIFANLGFDFLWFDMEHSADGFETTCDQMWSARSAGITPLARVPDPVRFYISRVLDAGAQGVIVPRIETVDQVDSVVSFCRYPPVGTRGVAMGGRHVDFEPLADAKEGMAEANRQVLVGIQIETKLGLDRVDELVARPGIDLVFIGPSDLSVALDVPNVYDAPVMDEAFAKIIGAANANDVPVGVQGRNIELSARWMEQGVRFVVYGNAVMLLTQGGKQGISQLKQVAERMATN